jgi:hypothetical protein
VIVAVGVTVAGLSSTARVVRGNDRGSRVSNTIYRELLTLGWSQYLVVIFGLCTIAVITAIELEPIDGLTEALFRLASQKYERQFGFEIGKIREWPHSPPDRIWGVARVTPGGRFDHAGIRSGDVVFTYHGGGFGALYYALKSANAGEPACLDIASLADWRAHRYISHEVCLDSKLTSMLAVPKPPPGLCERSGDWGGCLHWRRSHWLRVAGRSNARHGMPILMPDGWRRSC